MAGNSLGKLFRITSFGESHGPAIGLVIDGCPAGLAIDIEYIQSQLDQRRPGQSDITTSRNEKDKVKIVSGVFDGISSGTPICLMIENEDHRSRDYQHIKDQYRPSHADMVYDTKYGIRDYRGGGRSSARETATRVAAGAIAKLFLHKKGIKINAGVVQVGKIKLDPSLHAIDWAICESNKVRCPNNEIAALMEEEIRNVQKDGDTLGGIIHCEILNCPPGLGEPVFDKLHADLGKAMLSINAVKGFEYGSGFAAASMKGSDHNDLWTEHNGQKQTTTNYSGGIQGGISNGMPIYFNVAFKPVATIMKDQLSIDSSGEAVVIKGKGRHDPCVVPRAVPIVEAMAALVIADQLLLSRLSRVD